jgi:cell division septal protein FtsQ
MAGKPGRRSSAARSKPKVTAATAPDGARQPAWRQPPPKPRRRMRKQQTLAQTLNPAELAKKLTARPAPRPAPVATLDAAGTSRTRPTARPRWRIALNWRWLALVPVLALIAYGVAQLFTSYDFYVYAADIRGNQRVATQDIYAASGIDQQNIFWVNPQRVADNVTTVPGVAKAKVVVRLPNRVTIDVQERTPLAVWQTHNGDLWIDSEGAPMPTLGTRPTLTLIDANAAAADGSSVAVAGAPGAAAITGTTSDTLTSSDAMSVTAPTVDTGAWQLRPNVLAALIELHARRPDVTKVYYGVQEGLYFRAPEGWLVYLGDSGDIAGRLALLKSAQSRIAARPEPPSVVDLRVDGNAYLR